MEILGATLAVVDVTSRASAGIWRLCQAWRDAPEEVFQLRDEIDRADRFFCMLKAGIAESCDSPDPCAFASVEEVVYLLQQGQRTIQDLQEIVDELFREGASQKSISQPPLDAKVKLRSTRKLLWLRRAGQVKRSRMGLRKVISELGLSLTFLNL
jgi:hypothetical protein